jgi:hypothetical protein
MSSIQSTADSATNVPLEDDAGYFTCPTSGACFIESDPNILVDVY